jgi:hypothetical protein
MHRADQPTGVDDAYPTGEPRFNIEGSQIAREEPSGEVADDDIGLESFEGAQHAERTMVKPSVRHPEAPVETRRPQ